MDPVQLLKAFGRSLYPLAEPLLDDQIDTAAAYVGGAIVSEVRDTETKWDDEGAEKLARLLKGVAAAIETGLSAPAPAPQN